MKAARKSLSLAASQGNVEARYAYGEMLRLGLGGEADYTEAMKQYRAAANANHRQAQYRMGIMREQGWGAPAIDCMLMHGIYWPQRMAILMQLPPAVNLKKA